jgi:hypothetical protein
MAATLSSGVLFDFDRASVAPPPEALARFAQRTLANQDGFNGHERRTEVRHSIAINVLAIPLDANFDKCGEPFVAVTRDISASGIAIFHNRDVAVKFLALEIADPWGNPLRLILNVLRTRPLGLFYEIAGRFVMRMDSPAPAELQPAGTANPAN